MKKYILTYLFLITVRILVSQDTNVSYQRRPLNNSYINLLGDASIISINYEKLFIIKRSFLLTGKLGIGYSQDDDFVIIGQREKYLTIPIHLSTIIGGSRSFAELGFGATLIYGDSKTSVLYPILGYRLQPLKSSKLNFRIFILIPTNKGNYPFFSPIGLSMGISF